MRTRSTTRSSINVAAAMATLLPPREVGFGGKLTGYGGGLWRKRRLLEAEQV